MKLSHCPKCGVTWQGAEIPDGLRQYNPTRYPTIEAAREAAKSYGWTPENKLKFGINMIGIEIAEEYDGVGYWKCEKCLAVFDRFTGEQVDDPTLHKN